MKLDKKTVARRYARALFELVDEAGQLDPTYQELLALRQVITANPQLISSLMSVQLTAAQKKSLVDTLKNGASQPVANLIQMVFDYGRMNDLVAIIDEFERRYDAHYQRVHADVVTAVQLDDSHKQELANALAKRLGASEVLIDNQVDPSILGGVIVKTASQTLDGSVRTKIEQIRRLLVKK